MTSAHLLRTARRMAGVSQRELARRAGVEARTVADVERGRVTPNVATLTKLLTAADAELTLDHRLPDACQHLRRYLRLTLTQRLYLTFGGKARPSTDRKHGPWVRLWELSTKGWVQVSGDAAVGVWSPVVAVRPTVRMWVDRGWELPASTPDVEVLQGHGRVDPRLIPVALAPYRVLVAPPYLLSLGDVTPSQRLTLRVAARLLDEAAGVDDAGRRAAAHRDVNPSTDRIRVMHTKWFGSLPFPDPAAGRGWQLGGPVSLSQWLRDHGYPT